MISKAIELKFDRELNRDDMVHQYIINFKSAAIVQAWFMHFDLDESGKNIEYILPLIKPEAEKVLVIPKRIMVEEIESFWITKSMDAISFYQQSARI